MSGPKLRSGDAEAPTRLGEIDAIEVEKTNHLTVPGISEGFERRGQASWVKRAPNLKHLAKHLKRRRQNLRSRGLLNPEPLARGALWFPLAITQCVASRHASSG